VIDERPNAEQPATKLDPWSFDPDTCSFVVIGYGNDLRGDDRWLLQGGGIPM
jgi:hypothetical protein